MQQLDRKLPPHPLGRYKPRQGGRPLCKNEAPSCRGGHTTGGYTLEYSPDHPAATAQGLVLQHRLVAECYLGRLLEKDEHVHHRNGDRSDNRWENLEVTSRTDHHAYHHQPLPLTEARVRAVLTGHSTYEAARILHLHPNTIRRRFDHLLAKRRSPGASFPAYFVAEVRQLAADPSVSVRRAAEKVGVSLLTLRRCCRMEGIDWVAAPSGRPSHRRQAAVDAALQPSLDRTE